MPPRPRQEDYATQGEWLAAMAEWQRETRGASDAVSPQRGVLDFYTPFADLAYALPHHFSDDSELGKRFRVNSAASRMRDVGEMLLGPEEVLRAIADISGGTGTAGDYAVAGLSVLPVPQPVRKAAKRAGASLADSAAGRWLAQSNPVLDNAAARRELQAAFDSGADKAELSALADSFNLSITEGDLDKAISYRDNFVASGGEGPSGVSVIQEARPDYDVGPMQQDLTLRPRYTYDDQEHASVLERYTEQGRRGHMSADTGIFEVDPEVAARIPGYSGENRVPGDPRYDRLLPSMQEKGFSRAYEDQPSIWVMPDGTPYIAEGNTRTAVARDIGLDRIPATVSFFGGGERNVAPDFLENLSAGPNPDILSVSRRGLQPEANSLFINTGRLDDLRHAMSDPANNPALRLADLESRYLYGQPLDLTNMPQSSLQRQGGIARMFETATEGGPEYKSALFERYGEMMPQVVEQAGAQNYDQLVEAAYRALNEDVIRQFDRMPVSMKYHYGELEYPRPSEMFRDALGRGNLNVFRGGDPHPLLGDVDPATGLTGNEMFRAVHDYFGHLPAGSTFRPQGEEIAYATHAQQLSPLAQLALLAETRGQNSWVNYSPANAAITDEMNRIRRQLREIDVVNAAPRAVKEDLLSQLPDRWDLTERLGELGSQFQYARQEPVLLPPEYLDINTPGGVPDWARSLIAPRAPVSAQGQHYGRVAGLDTLDPSFYGTGHQGSEYPMVRNEGLPDRTYFYVGDNVNPEPEVARRAPFLYEGELSGLYDVNADPEGLVALAKAHNVTGYEPTIPYFMFRDQGIEGTNHLPDLERLIDEYGYSGYISDFGPSWDPTSRRAAASYTPVSVRPR